MTGSDVSHGDFASGPSGTTAGTAGRGRIGQFVASNQLASFFVLAFGLTFAWDAVLYSFVTTSPGVIPPWTAPRAWGPLVAAVTVTWLSGGTLRVWGGQLLDWHVKPRWFAVALAVPVLTTDAEALVRAVAGASLSVEPSSPVIYVGGFLITLLIAGALEEFGWRGFAQPRLQERYSAATAALVVGVAWACWHLPLYLVFDMAAYRTGEFLVSYLPVTVAQSLVYAWIFNATGGRLLPVMVIHAAGNMPGFLNTSGDLSGLAALLAGSASPIVWWGIALALVFAHGTQYLAPRSPDPVIPGFPGPRQGGY